MTAAHSPRVRLIASLLGFAVASLLALTPAAATAGTYTVAGTCGLWTPYNPYPRGIAVYTACPGLVTRNVGGNFTTPAGRSAGWTFSAPPGITVASLALSTDIGMHGGGWRATLMPSGNGWWTPLQSCPGSSCPEGFSDTSYPLFGASQLALRITCQATGGCPNSGALHAFYEILSSTFTLTDPTAPAVAILSSPLTSGGWKRGTQRLLVSGSDNIRRGNTGIHIARALIDGGVVGTTVRACTYGRLVPCSNGSTWVTVQTKGLADGRHTLVAQAFDGAGNAARTVPRALYVDNTPPTEPLYARLVGAAGWRSTNAFSVAWSNPPQRFAPIAG